MNGIQINLGRGIITTQSSVLLEQEKILGENIWETIDEFGISKDTLKKLDPSYKEIFEIYSAIKAYKISSSFLNELKDKLSYD